MTELNIPSNSRYTKTDEWIRVDGVEALIGLTDYAQSQLSDLVFIELPKVGTKLNAGATFGVVESVKAAADLNMPVSGEVVAVNSDLESAPDTMNQDPYGKGWIIRIRPSNSSDIDGLMDAASYTDYCNQRG